MMSNILCLVAVAAFFSATAVSQESCKGYYVKVKCGWWGWGRCKELRCYGSGTYTCGCPGTGGTVSYRISCRKDGNKCKAVNNNLSCNKYTNCATCRSEVNENEGGCSACKAGFQLVSGSCNTDINECSQSNPCQHECRNTYGSYQCSCRLGYALQSDGRSCARKSCGKPDDIAHGSIQATDSYLYDSYALYSCSDDQFVLQGNAVRKCLVTSTNNVYWNGSQPSCVDKCSLADPSRRRQCGLAVTETECLQLGCCFDSTGGQPSCFYREEYLSITFGREQVTDVPEAALDEYTVDGCSYSCLQTRTCETFVVQLRPDDQVKHQTCYLYNQSRDDLLTGEKITVGDESFDLHEPLDSFELNLEETDASSNTYAGCFADDTSGLLPFTYRIWSSQYNTPDRCVHACRQQGFDVAALKNGTDCFCGMESYITHANSSDDSICDSLCSGRTDVKCGGAQSATVYLISPDSRYIGCYNDRVDDPDFVIKLWSVQDSQPPSKCISDCLEQGFLYAALQVGTTCYCGNTFGRHGSVHYSQCRLECPESSPENCERNLVNTVFATARGFPISSTMSHSVTYRKLYITSERAIEVPFGLFTRLPLLRQISSPRFVLRVTGSVDTLATAEKCAVNCYQRCDQTQVPPVQSESQTIRLFFINLSELNNYVSPGARQVFVYAQTVVIDSDLSFPFSVQVNTRQLILDRSLAQSIRIGSESSTISVDVSEPERLGLQLDIQFLRQSFSCARSLLDSREQDDVNTAWAILHDLVSLNLVASADDTETSWLDEVKRFVDSIFDVRQRS